MKTCAKCNTEKEYNQYYKKQISKDGYNNICIPCRKGYNELNKENTQKYYKENKERYQENGKKHYSENKEKINNKSIEWGKNNPEKRKEIQDKWNKNNREYFKIWRKNKWETDPNFKLRIILGARLNDILKRIKLNKSSSIISFIGCPIEELKIHIENQFLPEFTWDNHGEIWELDHIIPCFNFDMENVEEQKKCFHYTNLQPLFKTTRIAKSFGYNDMIGNRNKGKK